MDDKILNIVNDLLKHEVSKSEACDKLKLLFTMNGIEPNTKAALNASVSAIYFSDRSDYLSYHYQVVRSLIGVEDVDIDKLFMELNPE